MNKEIPVSVTLAVPKNSVISREDHVRLLESLLKPAIDAGLFEAIKIEAEKPARIMISVSSGLAQVSAVEGKVSVIITDFDREGELMTPAAIEAALMETELSGNAADFEKAIQDARKGFEVFLGSSEPAR